MRIRFREGEGNPLALFLSGVSLIFISAVVLFFSEFFNGSMVDEAFFAVSKHAVSVPSSPVNRANDGKTVVVSGKVTTDQSLSDGIVSVPNVLVLHRSVEMYQWVEHVRTRRSGNRDVVSYSYTKEWSSALHNSAKFHHKDGHENRRNFPMQPATLSASAANLGDFRLDKKHVSKLEGSVTTLPLPSDLPSKGYVFSNGYYYPSVGAHDTVGGIRLRYSYIPSETPVSVVGTQMPGNSLTDKGGVFLAYDGLLSKSDILKKLKKKSLSVNLYRIGCLLAIMLGLLIIDRAKMTFLSFIPEMAKYAVPVSKKNTFLRALSVFSGVAAFVWLFLNSAIALLLAVGSVACWKKAKSNILRDLPPEMEGVDLFREFKDALKKEFQNGMEKSRKEEARIIIGNRKFRSFKEVKDALRNEFIPKIKSQLFNRSSKGIADNDEEEDL